MAQHSSTSPTVSAVKKSATALNYPAARQVVIDRYLASSPTRGVRRLIRELTDLVDTVVHTKWQILVETALPTELHRHLCLAAVGGYGRGELLPNSDVDVLILLDDAGLSADGRAQIDATITRWLGALWDIGMSPSHSVRTIAECVHFCHEDLSTETAILEGRFLCGERAVFEAFYAQFYSSFDVLTFWRNKVAEKNARYARFEETPFSLEPNCKESPGGLRDLQLVLWLTKAAKIATSWDELRRLDWLNERQTKLIKKCETLMLALRAHLHIMTRRLENRLLFDLQTGLAQTFGYEDGDGKRASERLMQKYYVAASVISIRLNWFLQKFEDAIDPDNVDSISHPIEGFPDFVERNHELDIVDADVFAHKPHLLLDMFYVFGTRPGLTACTPRMWDAVLKYRELVNPAFRRDPENKQRFLRILTMPGGITHTIRLMHQMGILGRYLPVFRKIIGQMQHDLFHIYTVDQHILMVVRNLRRFTMQEHIHQHELANQVMAEFGQPWLMYIAGLFHDVAKGRGGDHSKLGAVEVARFARSHRLTKEQTDLVVFLVREHLEMSQFAQKEDLSDPDVIARFADKVKTVERLQALYLLTVADIRGTSPKVWNAWKDKLLAGLYRATLRMLEGKEQAPRATLIKEKQERVRELLLRQVELPDWLNRAEDLWQHFNPEYFLRYDATTIAWHSYHIIQSAHNDTLVASQHYVLNDDDNCVQLMVYTADQPDLFARICSAIQQRGYSIFSADIYTSTQGWALDTFQIVVPEFVLVDQAFLSEFNAVVRKTVQQHKALRPPCLGRLSSRSRNFPIKPSMSLLPTGNDEYVVKLTATDRPGVLYSMAYILHELNIHLHNARITTLGERLEDVFVVHSPKLANPSFAAELERRLMAVCTI